MRVRSEAVKRESPAFEGLCSQQCERHCRVRWGGLPDRDGRTAGWRLASSEWRHSGASPQRGLLRVGIYNRPDDSPNFLTFYIATSAKARAWNVERDLPRRRNLWVTDTLQWAPEARLAQPANP